MATAIAKADPYVAFSSAGDTNTAYASVPFSHTSIHTGDLAVVNIAYPAAAVLVDVDDMTLVATNTDGTMRSSLLMKIVDVDRETQDIGIDGGGGKAWVVSFIRGVDLEGGLPAVAWLSHAGGQSVLGPTLTVDAHHAYLCAAAIKANGTFSDGTVGDVFRYRTNYGLQVGQAWYVADSAETVSVDLLAGTAGTEGGAYGVELPGLPISGFVSDNFTGPSLGAHWQPVVLPVESGTPGQVQFNAATDDVSLIVPAGAHYFPINTLYAVRMRQVVTDASVFGVEAEFRAVASGGNGQTQGFLIEQDSLNWLRVDLLYDESYGQMLFVGHTQAGTTTYLHNAPVSGEPRFLQLQRSGTTWTVGYREAGATSWVLVGPFTANLSMQYAGVFAANGPPSYDGWSSVVASVEDMAARLSAGDHLLTVEIAGPGTVTRSPDALTYDDGATVTLTAVPNVGAHFTGWSGDLTGATSPANLTMDADKFVTATFVAGYQLNVTIVGSGGSVTRSPDQAAYTSGTVVTLTAVPATGWAFVAWSGAVTGSELVKTVTMSANQTVTATFTKTSPPTEVIREVRLRLADGSWVLLAGGG